MGFENVQKYMGFDANWSERFSNPELDGFMRDLEQEMAINRVKGEIQQILPTLGKHRIEEIRRVIDRHCEKRFKGKRKIPKYGTLNKGFTEDQLNAFLRAIHIEKIRLLFEYQAYLGLRIGEVVQLNTKSINFETRELIVNTEKARTIDSLIIPLNLFNQTKVYVDSFKQEIEQADGYIFFKDLYHFSPREEKYIEPNYVRKLFRYYVEEAGLEEQAYSTSDESNGRSPRRLHRLTTHSLRHYAITHFSRAVNGNLILTSKFARHREVGVTMTYINTDKTELYQAVDRAFSTQY